MNEPQVFTGKGIRLYQLRAVISAIKLEQKGIRFKGSRNVRSIWARQLGLPPRCKPEAVIERLEEECRALGWKPNE